MNSNPSINTIIIETYMYMNKACVSSKCFFGILNIVKIILTYNNIEAEVHA